ncbi:hypothetical protein [Bradyrhizobium diazoefficiens]|uniref:Uncharacterized protein n=1 Tax=Bradyrhizobium diazoefficiens TaxID=1355477 RepID=A0A809ZHP2_9BRAD|nr:hypothetical protein XF1B_80170 [Bradyrhizobium diazoefficiens]BCE51595.1 hypothetical protein XF4B_79440 [Bradyrhizobium diazoefficiens]BCE95091.1 hypothetical protein XF10B_78890 [Bradyrhizobium diazoefficiens]BCF30037.1 hypothetical protein XF14B_79890 [Bradyrhizobium diazoefficiens]
MPISISNPRKKSPRAKGAPRATQATSARLKELWATPEFREKMKKRDRARIAAAKRNPAKFYRYGVPDGMRRHEAERLWSRANVLADRFIEVLKEQGELPDKQHTGTTTEDGTIFIPDTDEGKAEVTLREAFVLAVGPSTAQVKTRAIATVLAFTKGRPARKAAPTLERPEDLLDMIMNNTD